MYDDLTPEQIAELRKRIATEFKTLQQTVKNINRMWEQCDQDTFDDMCDDYPFEDGFEDVGIRINDWCQTVIKTLEK